MSRARRPTPRSVALVALARRLARRLVRNGAQGVAITGSVARGTATAGSDLDLWVLGPREGRRHLRVEGVNVTLLTNTPREALDVDRLVYWEVDDLLVLEDPRGHFGRVRATFAKHRRWIRDDVLGATREDLAREFALAARGSPWTRLLFLRQAGLRLAMVWLFLRTGWRVPRYALVAAELPAPARRGLARLLALPAPPTSRRALASARRATANARRWLSRRGVDARALVAPRELEARRAAGELDEAVVLARRFFTEVLVPEVLAAARGPMDVAALGPSPSGVRAALFALHGFDDDAARAVALAEETAREVAGLVRRLRLGPVLGAPLRRTLAALAR